MGIGRKADAHRAISAGLAGQSVGREPNPNVVGFAPLNPFASYGL